jgi:serine/threonine protein kinase
MLQLPASWLMSSSILPGDGQHYMSLICCLGVQPFVAYLLLQNCRNVLVRSNPGVPGGATAKLADFGLSRAMKQHQTHRTTKTCGTLSHMVSAAGVQFALGAAVMSTFRC